MTTHEAYYAAVAADAAWHGELVRIYGKHACEVRYRKAGRGKAGTVLRERYEAFRASTQALRGKGVFDI